MRLHAIAVSGLVLLVGGASLAHTHDVSVRFRFGTRERPLAGRRYQTMRALAHYLDERAEHAADQAAETAHHGGRNERRFLESVRHFARQTSEFHERMDRYLDSPWDVPEEVEHLDRDARRVSDRIRRAHVFEHTWDDWDAVLDVLDRMNRLLAGYDVRVPPAHRPGWRDDDRDYEPSRDEGREGDSEYRRGGYGDPRDSGLGTGGTRLTGRSLEEFRRLAHELDEQATQAHEAAELSADASARGANFLKDIDHFNEQTRALHEKADSGDLDPRDLGPTVNHLLQDARRTDRSLRASRVFADVWPGWTQVIRTLEQMAELVGG